ncbi:hypothetical protein H0H93_001217 [Arthromyces matolae]|nr:hypothetical protein H0H93_001217 [Arthromyces matolae]
MDSTYLKKNIVDLSEEELITLGFLGDSELPFHHTRPSLTHLVDAAPGIKALVEKVMADPAHLGTVTCFMVDCLKRKYASPFSPQDAMGYPASPTSPTSSAAEIYSQFSNDSDALTVVAPNLISKFEMLFWYHGISADPPKLLWRSDLETNPFPIPKPGTRFFKIPTKTAHGVFGTQLNAVWDIVAPQILASMKAHSLKYSALKTVRFSILEDGKEETFGPVVVWIAVLPNTTNAKAVRDATPDILQILADAQVTGVVVEWYEGLVKRLAGPPLMRVENHVSPTFGLNHPFNTGLGIPIARESDNSQGNLTLLFREVMASNGDPSNRILALTNKHIASVDTTTHYDFDNTDPQHILVCGERCFARAFAEIEDAVNTGLRDVVILAGELAELESKAGEQKSTTIRRLKNALDDKNEDNITLQDFYTEVDQEWKDTNGRRLGHVDWAPEISVSVDECHYTRDIATFTVDAAKLKNFERNIVDLGNQYTVRELEDRFWPIAAVRERRTIPANLQLPIRRALPPHLVNKPDTEDKNGEPLFIVGKYGNSTKLTFGRYSGMDAYICTDSGLESREMVVYNYSKSSGDFSDYGDSGSLIFTGDGDGLAILHSGMPRGMHNHVTYGTPLWWVIKQILEKYPFAEFYGITYTLD